MKKILLLLSVTALCFTSCKKESTPQDDSNLRVTSSIPLSEFHVENKVIIRVYYIPLNGGGYLAATDSSVNNKTIGFKLNPGHYQVWGQMPPNSPEYDWATTSNGQQYYKEVDVPETGFSTLSFTQWCQPDTVVYGGSLYCN